MDDEQNSTTHMKSKRWNGWGTAMVISFAIALTGPVFGLFGTIFGMMGAFDELGKQDGADPEALADYTATALDTTLGGMVALVAGLVLGLVFLALFLLKLDKDRKAAFAQNS
jgi:biopolymer transport protein ExbB/TolQ